MDQPRPQSGDLHEELAQLVGRAEALTSVLIGREGNAMGCAGDTSFLNVTAMAALVAGMFAATAEVARMVGEEHFSILLQQGERRHIHVSLVSEKAMLVVVFEDHLRIGRVRHEAKRASAAIAALLAARAADAPPVLATPRFKEYALDLIDRIFTVPAEPGC